MKTTQMNKMNELKNDSKANEIVNAAIMQVNKKVEKKAVKLVSEYQLNKKIAVSELDNELRGFNANLKTLKQLLNAKNTHVLQLFNDDQIKIENFNFDFLHANLPNRFNSKDRICKVKKIESPDGYEDFDFVNNSENKPVAVLIPCNKWTPLQFINLFKAAHVASRKKAAETFKATEKAKKDAAKIERDRKKYEELRLKFESK